MLFFYDRTLPEDAQVLHRDFCMKKKKIPPHHIAEQYVNNLDMLDKPLCKTCNYVYHKLNTDAALFDEYRNKGLMVEPDIIHNQIYVKSDIGFWIIYATTKGCYQLRHRNSFQPDLSLPVLIHGKFHIQTDRTKTTSIRVILDYILQHDRAKKIIYTKGYHSLPTDSKKQKKYYKSAKKKARDAEARRVWRLLESKEFQNAVGHDGT